MEVKKDVLAFVLAGEKQSKKLLSLKENQLKDLHKEITNLLDPSKKRKRDLLFAQSKFNRRRVETNSDTFNSN